MVDEGLIALEPAEPHRCIAARLDERGDPPEVGRPFVTPPEFFRTMIEARRPTGPCDDERPSLRKHPIDRGSAAGVEPGIVGRDMPAVRPDADHARHLAIDPDRGHAMRIDPAIGHAAADRAADAGILPGRIFFHHAGLRPQEPRRLERRREERAVGGEGGGLRALGADVDADENRHVCSYPVTVATRSPP